MKTDVTRRHEAGSSKSAFLVKELPCNLEQERVDAALIEEGYQERRRPLPTDQQEYDQMMDDKRRGS